VSYNGAALDDASHFVRLLSDSKIGSTATLGVLREGRTLSFKVPIVKPVPARRR
jgi:S1-C subfamily serine protease